MSNALAIAGTVAVIRDLLNDGLVNNNLDALGQFTVSSTPPDRLTPEPDQAQTNQLNVFVYNTTRNQGWSNERLPSRDPGGARVDSPYLALDLHFMLTATGAADLNAEILLGYGMQILHETPVLTRDAIRTALGVGGPVEAQILPAAMQTLTAADLAEQFERIRITPVQMDVEKLGDLWPMFNAPMRMSAYYQASCVLIESRTPVRSGPPVLTVGTVVFPMRKPRISVIRALPAGPGTPPDGDAPILPGGFVAIDGSGLSAEMIRVVVEGREVAVSSATPTRIEAQLPADLRAGVGAAQVEHLYVPEGGPPARLREISNVGALVVSPILAGTAVAGAVDGGLFTGTVTATLGHPVGPGQTVAVLLNALPGNAGEAVAVRAEPRQAAGTDVTAALSDVPEGAWLIRVEVDGAQSRLTTDAGGFNGPTVTLA